MLKKAIVYESCLIYLKKEGDKLLHHKENSLKLEKEKMVEEER